MREAGEVCYADVSRDGTGAVEFTRLDDMKYALKKLDDTKFRSHEVKGYSSDQGQKVLIRSGKRCEERRRIIFFTGGDVVHSCARRYKHKWWKGR